MQMQAIACASHTCGAEDSRRTRGGRGLNPAIGIRSRKLFVAKRHLDAVIGALHTCVCTVSSARRRLHQRRLLVGRAPPPTRSVARCRPRIGSARFPRFHRLFEARHGRHGGAVRRRLSSGAWWPLLRVRRNREQHCQFDASQWNSSHIAGRECREPLTVVVTLHTRMRRPSISRLSKNKRRTETDNQGHVRPSRSFLVCITVLRNTTAAAAHTYTHASTCMYADRWAPKAVRSRNGRGRWRAVAWRAAVAGLLTGMGSK